MPYTSQDKLNVPNEGVRNPSGQQQQEQQQFDSVTDQLMSLFVTYIDDDIDECIKRPIRQKTRVKYNCFDATTNFLTFGASSGAVYLFRLEAITHSSCSLVTTVPCNQGPVEVIKFLPSSHADNLIIAIGTSRGSLIVYKLTQSTASASEFDIACDELYRAEAFTSCPVTNIVHGCRNISNNNGAAAAILIPKSNKQHSNDYRLFASDYEGRIFCVEDLLCNTNRFSAHLFFTNQTSSTDRPKLLIKIDDSKINQLDVYERPVTRSSSRLKQFLLISTNKSSLIYDVVSGQLRPVGRKQRKDEGFYGACFMSTAVSQEVQDYSAYDHRGSLSALTRMGVVGCDSTEDLANHTDTLIYVARPSFRLWRVNMEGNVQLTHQFETSIRDTKVTPIVSMSNTPLTVRDGQVEESDNTSDVIDNILNRPKLEPKADHFERLITMNNSTLGQCLLSHTRDELFVINPDGAQLVAWTTQDSCLHNIHELCYIDNEIYVFMLSTRKSTNQSANTIKVKSDLSFQIKRIVLLSPTQYVLELHRLRRFESLVIFVEANKTTFKSKMALPLTGGQHVITTEGGLLRNVLLNAWTQLDEDTRHSKYPIFDEIISLILEESRQFRDGILRAKKSQLGISSLSMFSLSAENLDRLLHEPYASLVSLNVSLGDLHTNHVIHFSRESMIEPPSLLSASQSHQQLSTVQDSNRGVLVQTQDANRKNFMNSCHDVGEDQKQEEKVHKNEQPQTRTEVKRLNESTKDLLTLVERISSFRNESTQRLIVQEYACPQCGWPRPGANRKHVYRDTGDSSTIEARLINRLEELLSGDTIEQDLQQDCSMMKPDEIAFANCLWNRYLRFLIKAKQYDKYIKCAIMLDDIKLLRNEPQIMAHLSKESTIRQMLSMIVSMSASWRLRDDKPINDDCIVHRYTCLECSSEITESQEYTRFSTDHIIDFNQICELSLNCIGPRLTVNIMLDEQFVQLLDNSYLSSRFYIHAIELATISAHQSPLLQNRIKLLTRTD